MRRYAALFAAVLAVGVCEVDRAAALEIPVTERGYLASGHQGSGAGETKVGYDNAYLMFEFYGFLAFDLTEIDVHADTVSLCFDVAYDSADPVEMLALGAVDSPAAPWTWGAPDDSLHDPWVWTSLVGDICSGSYGEIQVSPEDTGYVVDLGNAGADFVNARVGTGWFLVGLRMNSIDDGDPLRAQLVQTGSERLLIATSVPESAQTAVLLCSGLFLLAGVRRAALTRAGGSAA